MSRSVSVTAAGQCRLGPLIQVILDCSHLYDYTVKLLFKLHSCEYKVVCLNPSVGSSDIAEIFLEWLGLFCSLLEGFKVDVDPQWCSLRLCSLWYHLAFSKYCSTRMVLNHFNLSVWQANTSVPKLKCVCVHAFKNRVGNLVKSELLHSSCP